MTSKARPPGSSLADLRLRAEAAIARMHANVTQRVERDVAKLMHELDVHRTELELQNDELQRTRAELENSARRYRELYDHAPVGYLTLDRGGRIRDANRRAGELLGGGAFIEGRALDTFTRMPDAHTLRSHLEAVFSVGGKHVCEVTLHVRERRVPVRIDSVAPGEIGELSDSCCSVLIDLSELRGTELPLRRTDEASGEPGEGPSSRPTVKPPSRAKPFDPDE